MKPKTDNQVKREYINAMAALIMRDRWKLQQNLEHGLCRCSPLRAQKRMLESEREEEITQATAEIRKRKADLDEERSKLYDQEMELSSQVRQKYRPLIGPIENQIEALDQEDHPRAHEAFSNARTFARLWVIEQLERGVTLPTNQDELQLLYVKDLASGWVPTPHLKPVTLCQDQR